MFWSHKVLRWFTPHLLLLTVLGSVGRLMLTGVRSAPSGFVVPAGCVLAGGLWLAARLVSSAPAPLAALDHFLTMQAALFVGFLRYARGGVGGAWTRTPRRRPAEE